MKKAFLSLKNLSKKYADKVALTPTSVDIPTGKFISILGPSGCGKTTTLMLLAGIEQPTTGEILFKGQNISPIPLEKRGVGVVFQNFALFPNLTVKDNILYGLVGNLTKDKIERKYEELISLVKLEGFSQRYPHELSGGQQQRVAIARALAMDPILLLLDEPLSALDAWSRSAIGNELREIQRKSGVTTVMVTHDRSEALSLSDFILVMNHGVLEQSGTPREIYDAPASEFVAIFVGGMNILRLPKINNALPTGIRYGDVQLLEVTEANLEKEYSVITKVSDIDFLGDTLRVKLLLNDMRTLIIAELPRVLPIVKNLKVNDFVVADFPRESWRLWGN